MLENAFSVFLEKKKKLLKKPSGALFSTALGKSGSLLLNNLSFSGFKNQNLSFGHSTDAVYKVFSILKRGFLRIGNS